MGKLKLLQNFRKINFSPQKPIFSYFYFEFLKFKSERVSHVWPFATP